MSKNKVTAGIIIVIFALSLFLAGMMFEKKMFYDANNEKKPDSGQSQILSGEDGSFSLGDVNGDGSVTAADMVKLARYIENKKEQIVIENADLTSDGKTDKKDLDTLKNILAQ
ncbi:MAG: hypothetical protein E7505_06730 [Ruminococcus sp.]|nr:hypothetical protein [Ruminococcus sp.]